MASLGRQLNSVSQEATKLPHRRNDLQGLTRIDTMPWVLALRVTCGWGREGEPASQSFWRRGEDTRAAQFGEHYWETTWSIALKQLVYGALDSIVYHLSLQPRCRGLVWQL